jgi:predicted nucleic acid-binding protein
MLKRGSTCTASHGIHLGIALDSSVLVAAERKHLTTPEVIRRLRENIGDLPIVICALTVAELGHGIYRADSQKDLSTAVNSWMS